VDRRRFILRRFGRGRQIDVQALGIRMRVALQPLPPRRAGRSSRSAKLVAAEPSPKNSVAASPLHEATLGSELEVRRGALEVLDIPLIGTGIVVFEFCSSTKRATASCHQSCP
jgi:hypothetical protein